MKRFIIPALAVFISFGAIVHAAFPPSTTGQGGTGTTTPSGILYGSNSNITPLQTVSIGSNLTFSAGTLSASNSGTISTSSPLVSGQPLYATGVSTLASVASSTFLTSIGGQTALGFTPYNATNPSNYISLTALSATYPILYNNSTGAISTALASSTLTASSPLTGSFAQVGTGGTLGIQVANTSQGGYLTNTDWNTFNGKQNALGSLTGIIMGNAGSFYGTATSSPIAMSITGNAATVTTNANLTGVVTSVGNATAIADGAVAPTKLSGTSGYLYYTDSTGFGGQDSTLTFNDTTKALSAKSFSGAGTGLTGTAASLTAGTVTTNANLTGDVTSSGNATTIGANKVTLGMHATLAANSVIGNLTGTTATPTAVATTSLYTLGSGLVQSTTLFQQKENRSFSYATSTAWTATTTIPLSVGYGEVWNNAKCFTDAGTLNVDFYHASTHFTFFNASTTVGTVGMNATDTSGDKVYVDIGTPATSPTKISCTLNDTI